MAASLTLAAKEDPNEPRRRRRRAWAGRAPVAASAPGFERRLDGGGSAVGSRAEGDALAGERELDLLARLVDPPLDGGERDLERVGDLGVREPDDVAQQQRHLQVDVQLARPRARRRRSPRPARTARRAPRAAAMSSRFDDRARPALERAQLVEHAVLRHLEEPGREPAAEREARQALVDAEEDLLRQVLGERAVADEPEDVVEDRRLVRADDEREGPLVTSLGLPQDAEIRLWQRQVGGSIAPRIVEMEGSAALRRLEQGRLPSSPPAASMPEQAAGPSARGRRARRRPRAPRSREVTTSGTGFVVCAVCGLTPSGSSICSALPWSAVTRQTPPARVTRLDDRAEARVGRLDGRDRRPGSTPVWPTMSGFAKLTTAKR